MMNFEKRKRVVWDEVEKDMGLDFPLAKDFKDYVEIQEVGDPKQCVEGDPEGEEEYLESLRSVAIRYLTGLKLLKANTEGKSSEGSNEKSRISKQQRRGPFERRLRLVGFVIDCWERAGRSYIPWEYVTAEWNKANPHSPIVSKDTFERAYRRAVKEDGIMIQLLVIKASVRNKSVSDITKRLEGEQERQIFKELINADKGQDGESVLSLLYKHYVLTEKQEVSNRRRDIMLSLAKRYEKLGEAEKVTRQGDKPLAVPKMDQMQE